MRDNQAINFKGFSIISHCGQYFAGFWWIHLCGLKELIFLLGQTVYRGKGYEYARERLGPKGWFHH